MWGGRCTWGLAWVLASLLCMGGFLPPLTWALTEPAQARRWTREQRRRWLQSVCEKVMEDSRRLVELAVELRAEAEKGKDEPLPPELLNRLQALEPEARKLLAAVEEFDENFLVVSVITTAEKIEAEAKFVRQSLKEFPPVPRWRQLSRLVRKVQKHADSIKDRTRMP